MTLFMFQKDIEILVKGKRYMVLDGGELDIYPQGNDGNIIKALRSMVGHGAAQLSKQQGRKH